MNFERILSPIPFLVTAESDDRDDAWEKRSKNAVYHERDKMDYDDKPEEDGWFRREQGIELYKWQRIDNFLGNK